MFKLIFRGLDLISRPDSIHFFGGQMPLVLIDGSNAWYRAYCANPGLSVPGGPMLIFTSMLRKLANQFGKDNLIICWDAGDGGRKTLDTEYKAQRVAVTGVWEHLPLMTKLVSALGISTAIAPGYEGDDVIGSLAKAGHKAPKSPQCNDEVLIVSYDKDFYQLVTDKVKVFKPARKIHGNQKPDEFIGPKEASEDFGCSPERIPLLKAFLGDNSDNIPKIPLRLVAAVKDALLKRVAISKTVDEFYEDISGFDVKHHETLLNFKDRARLSFELLKIKVDLVPKLEIPVFNELLIEEICQKVDIKSLKIQEWKDLQEPEPIAISQSLF